MFTTFLRTENDVAALILRLALGLVILPHGAQKLLGWFGGYGLQGTLSFFTGTLGVPLILALLVIAAESFGALGLIAGFATRLCAFGVAAVMTGAIFMVHLPNGFFMNWGGKQAGEGFEYHLLAIGIALALMVKGGGALSLDRLLARKR
jgi:putative oxidoreductase